MLIGVCTHRRHEPLRRLLQSFAELTLPLRHRIALVVVENDKELTITEMVAEQALPFPADVVLEPNAGLSNARNRLLDEAIARDAEILICVDDDEVVVPGWARGFEVGFERLAHCDVLMGWVDFAFEGEKSPWMTPHDLGRQVFGQQRDISSTTNYGVRRSTFFDGDGQAIRFDPKYNTSGGEDTVYFLQLRKKRRDRFGTVPQARSIEYITEDRATLRWMLSRAWTQNICFYRILCEHYRTESGRVPIRAYRIIWRHTIIRLFRFFVRLSKLFAGQGPLGLRLKKNIGLVLFEAVTVASFFGFMVGVQSNTYATAS